MPKAAKRRKAKRKKKSGGRESKARDLWLFAYGSLVWNGALGRVQRHPARLFGYHRSLCIYSHIYRGTVRRPGLVLGLARGGSCRGMALKLPSRGAARWLARIRARENVTGVYLEKMVRLQLPGGPGRKPHRVAALAFIADPTHRQFAGKLSQADILRCLRQGKGSRGRSADYLTETVSRLRALGIRDRALERIAAAAGSRI